MPSRVLLLGCCVLASALGAPRVDARPARPRMPQVEPEIELDQGEPSPTSCARSRTFEAFARCRFAKARFEIVKQLPNATLVAVDDGLRDSRRLAVDDGLRDSRRLALYVYQRGRWTDGRLYANFNRHTELLGMRTIAPETYAIELGHAFTSPVTLDEVTTRHALHRRTITHVCRPSHDCQQVMTRCEVLVHGKSIAAFRGEPVWDGRRVKLRVDLRNTNRYCAPSPAHVVEDAAR